MMIIMHFNRCNTRFVCHSILEQQQQLRLQKSTKRPGPFQVSLIEKVGKFGDNIDIRSHL
jgi:hypothetical protein